MGTLIRMHRLAVPLTQQELADKVGIHRKSIEAIESGKSKPRPATIRKLAEVLEVPASDLARAAQAS